MKWFNTHNSKIFPPTFIIFAVSVLAGSYLCAPAGLPVLNVCYFKTVTGLPCPACGITRGICAISHGRWRQAAALNPFAFMVWGFLALFLVLAVLNCFFPNIEPFLISRKKAGHSLLYVFLALLIFFGVFRIYYLLQARQT